MAEKWIVCRICLQQPNEIMQQIFDVDEAKDLTQMILECGGVPIKQFDHYPDKICSKCMKYLRVAYKFRETCQRSYKHLSRFIAPVEVESKVNLSLSAGDGDEPEVIVPSTHHIENDDDTNQSELSNLQAVPIDFDGEHQYVVHLRDDNNISVNNVKEEYQDPDDDVKFGDDEIVAEVVDGVVDIYAPMDDDDFEEIEEFETMDRDGSNITEVVEYLDDIGDHLSSDEEFMPKRPGNFSKVVRSRGRPPKSESSPRKLALKASNGKGINNLTTIKREKYKRQSKYDESGQLKTFICDVCGNTYPTQGRLREHIKSHNGLKPHECEICGHAFAQNQQLARHMNTHTGNRPYKCQYCPSAFADLSTRNKHHRIHTNERPYVCDVCGKAFAYTNTLKFHKMIHTGEKPFVCDICGKGFHQAYKLRNHKATHEKRGVKREKLDESLIEIYNEATDGNSQISEM